MNLHFPPLKPIRRKRAQLWQDYLRTAPPAAPDSLKELLLPYSMHLPEHLMKTFNGSERSWRDAGLVDRKALPRRFQRQVHCGGALQCRGWLELVQQRGFEPMEGVLHEFDYSGPVVLNSRRWTVEHEPYGCLYREYPEPGAELVLWPEPSLRTDYRPYRPLALWVRQQAGVRQWGLLTWPGECGVRCGFELQRLEVPPQALTEERLGEFLWLNLIQPPSSSS
jgi:hypothetical protein